MLCQNPYKEGVAEYGCGRCLPCLRKRRRLWAARLMLELYQHRSSMFLTLTYKEAPAELVKEHLQEFIRNLRYRMRPFEVRYYGVGEYGERGGRPHYHVIIFGCDEVEWAKQSWNYGFVGAGEVNVRTAMYICKYVLKSRKIVGSRVPEFAVMSLKPGIGADSADEIGRCIFDSETGELRLPNGDVPTVYRVRQQRYGFGRYLRKRIRRSAGVAEEVGRAAARLRNMALAEKLKDVAARIQLEEQRWQDGEKARVRESISTTERMKKHETL